MKDVRATNLRTLLKSRVTDDDLAARALASVVERRLAPPDLAELLRHHEQRGVNDPNEIALREGFDRLLAAWSVVEIGASIGAYPDPLPEPIGGTMRTVLEAPAVRAFYTTHYPVPLITRLASRLSSNGVDAPSASEPMSDTSVFRSFVDLDWGFVEDPELRIFLMMLDDFHWGDVSIETVVAQSKTAESFGRAVAGGDDIPPILTQGARGFLEFLSFTSRLDELLERAAPTLTQSIALHYAYWFNAIGQEINDRLGTVLDVIESWREENPSSLDGEGGTTGPDTRAIRCSMERLLTRARTAVSAEAQGLADAGSSAARRPS